MTYKELLALLAEKSKFGDFETQGLYRGLHGFFSQTPKPKGHKGPYGDRPGSKPKLAPDYGPSYQGRPTKALESTGYPGAMYSDGTHTNVWYNGQHYSAADFWKLVQAQDSPLMNKQPQQPQSVIGGVDSSGGSGGWHDDRATGTTKWGGGIARGGQSQQPKPTLSPDYLYETKQAHLAGPRGAPTEPRSAEDNAYQLNRLQEQKGQTRNTRLDQFKRKVF